MVKDGEDKHSLQTTNLKNLGSSGCTNRDVTRSFTVISFYPVLSLWSKHCLFPSVDTRTALLVFDPSRLRSNIFNICWRNPKSRCRKILRSGGQNRRPSPRYELGQVELTCNENHRLNNTNNLVQTRMQNLQWFKNLLVEIFHFNTPKM